MGHTDLDARPQPTDAPARRDWAGELSKLIALEFANARRLGLERPGVNVMAAHIVAALRLHELEDERDRLRAEMKRLKGERILSVVFGHHKGAPRPFALYGSGRVLAALGAEFPDGAVALRLADDGGWTTRSSGGADQFPGVEVVWLSDELPALAEMEQQRDEAVGKLDALRAGLAGIDAGILAGESPADTRRRVRALLAADMSTPDGTTTAETSEGDER